MSVGLLIITHDGIGASLLGTTSLMLGDCPLKAKLLMASRDSKPDELKDKASEYIEMIDSGDGVLILTDLYGSTPSNIGALLKNDHNISIVTGLNLPMLVRVLNYPDLYLDELSDKALSGGHDGIMLIEDE